MKPLSLAATLAIAIDLAGVGAGHPLRGPQDSGRVPLLAADQDRLAVARAALAEASDAREAGRQAEAGEALGAALEALEGLESTGVAEVLDALQQVDAVAQDLGALELQRAARERLLSARRRLLATDDPELVDSRFALAETLFALREWDRAGALFEEVLAAYEHSSSDHPNRLTTLGGLGRVRAEQGDFEGALALQLAWLEGLERLHSEDHTHVLAAKDSLAMTRKGLGDLEGALAIQEEILASTQRVHPPDHPERLSAKGNLAYTRAQLGQHEQALLDFEEVLAAREKELPSDHPSLLITKNNMALTLAKLGDSKAALVLQKEVLAAKERTLAPDHPSVLLSKGNLAMTHASLGDLEGALVLEEEVLSALMGQLPPEHPTLLNAMGNLALTRAELDDLEGALALQEPALVTLERLLPSEHPLLLTAKNNLAITRSKVGDFEGGLVLMEQVVAVKERQPGSNKLEWLVARNNLAVARKKIGDFDGALELHEEVLADLRRLLPPEHPRTLVAMSNMASMLFEAGDLEGARELQDSVLAAQARSLPPSHPSSLVARSNLAKTLRGLGDLEGARELQEQVLKVQVGLLPPDHPSVLLTRNSLAGTLHALGDLEGTLEMARALLLGQDARAVSLRSESPRLARSAALVELQRLPGSLYWSDAAPSAAEDLLPEIYSTIENLRIVSTSSSAVALARRRFPELGPLSASLGGARSALHDHALAPPAGPGDLAAWKADLVRLVGERDRLERRLRSALEERGVFAASFTVAQAAAALGEGAASISFYRYPRVVEADSPGGAAIVDSVLAFVVTSDAVVRRVELGPSSELEELALAWRHRIGKPVLRGLDVVAADAAPDQTEEGAGRMLRERLLDPCLEALGDERPQRLYLVLDDFLHLLPIDALPWVDGRRLGDALQVRFDVSMLRLVAPPSPVPEGGTLVAIGGVDFDAEGVSAPVTRQAIATPPLLEPTDRSPSSPGSFVPLRQTRYEAEDLGRQYMDAFDSEAVVLLRAAATKRALFEAAPDARYLHLATHGWFARETFTSMRDAPAAELGLESAAGTVRGFAPETLCGLALAGANSGRDALGKVPGILTAEELATLDLSRCDLAVLSACETNVGLRRAGQGIQSLQGALHAAGARTAVTSLWEVDDAATRRLMEIFYTILWDEGGSKADALWEAKRAMAADGAPPKDWAGWVLTGDPD